jgi:drug/metabolite transporter (DMT)-like permease
MHLLLFPYVHTPFTSIDQTEREDIMKFLARGSFLLVTVLWGSFYAVAKAALTHVDPIIFTFFEAMVLVPIALTLLVMHRRTVTRAALTRGFLLGSCLCIATLTITVSEQFTGAATTAFFPSTGGTFAAIITALVFGRSLAKSIWAACLLSLLGVLVLLHASLSSGELRGDVIALLGALLFTVYLFLVDQDAQQEGEHFWASVGIEHLSFALWMVLFALLFGDWQHFHPVLSHDIPVILYVSLACTFLPVILTHVAQRHLDPLETSFISILEPLWGVLIAHLSLGDVISLPMSIGGGLILCGTLIHLIAGGNSAPFFQRITSLLQAGGASTRNAFKKWRNLALFPAFILFLRRMIAWHCQHASQTSVLLLHFWPPFLINRTRWDQRTTMDLFPRVWYTFHTFLPLQHAVPYGWMNARKRVRSCFIPLFSVWHVLCKRSANLAMFWAYSHEKIWQHQAHHSAPP